MHQCQSQEGFSWNGLPAHLICLPLKISGVGWSNKWVTERASTLLINNTDDLQNRLMVIRDSITLTQLHVLFDGMNERMKRVVKLQGSHIGK